jgi:hypothetical protein
MMIRPLVLIGLLIFASAARAADWIPPADPEPEKILKEAQEDAKAGRYETALIKHIWFHRNALKYAPLQSGNRHGTALNSWKELGEKFPPAMEDFKAERDRAKKNVLENRNAVDAMADFSNMNRVLGEERQTADVFAIVDHEQPENAALAYLWAENALIKNKRYELCNKYCDPDRFYSNSLELYKLGAKAGAGRPWEASTKAFAEKHFTKRSATIVALLVINKRQKEAEAIAAKAKAELALESHQRAIDEALQGTMPDQTR